MRRFLISLSGVRPEILDKCPTERGRFEGIGGAVLTTSVLAAVSMWFALYSALGVNPLLALPVAAAWGLAIMSLDRWLVGSIPAEGGRRWRLAVPRLMMAMLLGAVISTPLVLQIFHSEIDAQIVEIKQNRADRFVQEQQRGAAGRNVAYWRKSANDLQKVITSNGDVPLDPSSDPRIRSLTTQREGQQRVAQKHYQEWQCQLYGGSGCKKKGDGPLAQASKDAYDKAQRQVSELNAKIAQRTKELSQTDENSKKVRLQQAQSDLPKAQAQYNEAIRQQNDLQARFNAENRTTNGLLIRLQALDELSGRDFTLRSAQILLFLLFLLIECLPVTVKLLQKAGNYEKVLQIAAREEFRSARESYGSQFRSGTDRQGTPLRKIWNRGDSGPAGERLRPSAPAADDRPMADPPPQHDTRDDDTSLDDMALREMEDTRVLRMADGSAPRERIELFGDDDDF